MVWIPTRAGTRASTVALLALAMALVAIAARADEAAMADSHAEVLFLNGSVQARNATGGELRLAVGARLVTGDTLVTGADGTASLRLIGADDSLAHDHMFVAENSELAIGSLLVAEDASQRSLFFRLLDGAISVVTSRSGETRKLIEVETPTAIGGVRGTEFRLTVERGDDGAPATRAETLESTVWLTAAGAELEVGAGYGARVRDGEPPGELHALPAAPAPQAPAAGATLEGFEFSWQPVDGATRYLLEIAGDDDFTRRLTAVEVEAPAYAPVTAALPQTDQPLYWRVSATDGDGFQGPASDPRPFRLPSP